jgi:hypothetical protein
MLVAWIGTADLRAPDLNDESDVGPIAQAVAARSVRVGRIQAERGDQGNEKLAG